VAPNLRRVAIDKMGDSLRPVQAKSVLVVPFTEELIPDETTALLAPGQQDIEVRNRNIAFIPINNL
jgi:hypothetical protein